MPAKSRHSLGAVLKLADPGAFLAALAELDDRHDGVDFIARPTPLGMIGGLNALYTAVLSGGIAQFLDQDEGRGFHKTEAGEAWASTRQGSLRGRRHIPHPRPEAGFTRGTDAGSE